jgi:hypothetical protein
MSIESFDVDRCDLRSCKFTSLLCKPLGDKLLDELPGIGVSTSKKLQQTKHIDKAKDLLHEFMLKFQFDHEQFRLWLMNDYSVTEYRATECVTSLIDYIEQAKKYDWPLT